MLRRVMGWGKLLFKQVDRNMKIIITDNSFITIAALFLIGLGNGPMFPNLNYLTPEQFGEERSAALIGAQMAVANTAIVVSPLFFGFLGQALGMGLFGYFLLFFYVFLIIGVILNRRQFKFSSANAI